MAPNSTSPLRKIMNTLGSVKTGVILLIVIGVVSASGTFVLQRPITEPETMQQAYSPQTLRILDAIGLTDVFHAWWFIVLMALFASCIICVSIERWPNAWRFYSRPYRRPDSHFRRGNRNKREFPVMDADAALKAAETAFSHKGLKAERINDSGEVSLFAERARFSVFAVYVVHASILLILIGGIIDGLYGFKGYLNLVSGSATDKIELRDNTTRSMPFTLRCDGAGQENYSDGSPKRWWSKLTVLENGQEVLKKEIVVNDPLIYRGVRFYQSGFGVSDEVEQLTLNVLPQSGSKENSAAKQIVLTRDEPTQVDANTTVRFVQLIPDYYMQDGEVFRRSNGSGNPAVQLSVTASGKDYKVWLFPRTPEQAKNDSPLALEFVGGQRANFTGLAVSHEPGQWAVWAGCVMMGLGLILAFYTYHTRWWAQVVSDGQGGLTLWVGAAASKQREAFAQRFRDVADEVEKQLNATDAIAVPATATPTVAEPSLAVTAGK